MPIQWSIGPVAKLLGFGPAGQRSSPEGSPAAAGAASGSAPGPPVDGASPPSAPRQHSGPRASAAATATRYRRAASARWRRPRRRSAHGVDGERKRHRAQARASESAVRPIPASRDDTDRPPASRLGGTARADRGRRGEQGRGDRPAGGRGASRTRKRSGEAPGQGAPGIRANRGGRPAERRFPAGSWPASDWAIGTVDGKNGGLQGGRRRWPWQWQWTSSTPASCG